MKEKYNGWTNYATWRINLEVMDGIEIDTKQCAASIKEIIEDVVFNNFDTCDTPRLVEDYARAFVSEVNFYEIAENINEELKLQAEYDN